jgi:EAL domain-containing protein (putative c-di-GMP-specific phosphodiesterase class I)
MAVEAEVLTARLKAEFPHALSSGQLVAYYQPEVELSSGRVVAAESLVRWEHPEFGTLPPALFTPVAAQLGLMGELTRLMLRLSLVQHRVWAAAGWVVPISVNVDPDSVTDPGFPAVIAEFLRAEQVPGRMLALEVSEQTATAAVSISFFAQLAALGVRVALDDFGTGFASLESLGGWPVNELKLDMSLVRPIASNASFRTIVRTTVDLAHQLGVKVVAEGIESEAVRSELQALGCDFGQGFLLGRPMAPAAFADWLRQRDHSRRPIPAQAGASATEPVPGDRGSAGRTVRWLRQVIDPVGGPTLAAAVAIMAAYGLWQVFRWGHQHQALIGDLAFFLPNAAGGYCAWRVSRRTDLGRVTAGRRVGWRWAGRRPAQRLAPSRGRGQLSAAYRRRPAAPGLRLRRRRAARRGAADLPGQRASVRRAAGLRLARDPVPAAGLDRRDDRPVQPAPFHGGGGGRLRARAAAGPAAVRADDRRGPLQADQRRARPRRG